MAQFNFEMSVTDATRMDAPMERGLMRWQRKALEAGVNRLAISDSKYQITFCVLSIYVWMVFFPVRPPLK